MWIKPSDICSNKQDYSGVHETQPNFRKIVLEVYEPIREQEMH